MTNRLIEADRSIIVSADVDLDACGNLALALAGVEGIYAVKAGFVAGLDEGLWEVESAVRANMGEHIKLIYDHQKAGNDIPDMGPKFAGILKQAKFDAAILFPFAGPKTQTRWTKACMDAGLRVLIGGVMTHSEFLASEGGYITDDTPERIFNLACDQGVTDFVVPGTKINWVKKLRALLETRLGLGNFDLYAPGFITQGGDISECGLAAGPRFHAIVGSAIYDKETFEERRAAAELVTSKIRVLA